MIFTTRFAPSPTGPLHLGHAYSALLAHDMARARGGQFHLRIDDLDTSRARPEWEAQLKDDLTWLGLTWPAPCRRESDHGLDYDAALDRLWQMGLLYPCTCTRRDIRNALSAPQEGQPLEGPDGLIYPRTCAKNGAAERGTPPIGPRPKNATLRLDMALACAQKGLFTQSGNTRPCISFTETGHGPNGETGLIKVTPDDMINRVGDVVLARKDAGASYHLAVVVDDNAQGITHVVRGQDLFHATKIHIILQWFLGITSPEYHHHALIRDDQGKRLAKRDDARAIAKYRADGASPLDIRAMIGLSQPQAS